MIMYYRKFQFNIKSDKYNFAYIKFIQKMTSKTIHRFEDS